MHRKIQIIALLLACTLCIGSCTHNIVDINPPTGSSSGSYGWNTAAGQLVYFDSTALTGTTIHRTLTFTAVDTNNNFTVTQTSNNTTEYFTLVSTADSQSVSGLSASTVIPIPDGFTLSHNDTVKKAASPILHATAIYNYGYVVTTGTDIYYKLYKDEWKKTTGLSLLNGEEITRLSANGGPLVFAATSTGAILISADTGKSWNIRKTLGSNTSIDAMMSVPFGATYVVAGNGNTEQLWQFISTTPTMLYDQLPMTNVTSVAPITVDSLFKGQPQPIILIGSSRSGLYYANVGSSQWNRFKDTAGQEFLNDVPIRFIGIDHSQLGFVVQASNLFIHAERFYNNADTSPATAYHWSVASKNYDQAIPYTQPSNYICRAGNSLEEYSFQSYKTLPLPDLTGKNISEIAVKGDEVLAVTDSGLYHLTGLNGSTWAQEPLPTYTNSIITPVPDKLLLLSSGTSGLVVGASWDAGVLRSSTTAIPYDITATVSDHFDSLQLSKNVSYSDIYKIVYTLKDGINANQLDRPSWTIYFAKDQGPVLIDLSINGVLRRRIYRTN